jgi:hypothetical protein
VQIGKILIKFFDLLDYPGVWAVLQHKKDSGVQLSESEVFITWFFINQKNLEKFF